MLASSYVCSLPGLVGYQLGVYLKETSTVIYLHICDLQVLVVLHSPYGVTVGTSLFIKIL